MYRAWLECIRDCGERFPLNEVIYTCPKCGGLLDVEHDVITRTGLHCAPLVHEGIGTFEIDGTVRFSPGVFTTDEEVERAMAEVPPDYRAVVIMALVEEMSYKEIAAALSIPLGTVMSRLHRGRKLLQTRLLEYARRRGILSSGSRVSPSQTED